MFSEAIKKIAIVDFGGQYTHLIARRIRNLGIYSEIYQPEKIFPDKDNNIIGIIFSGGPRSVTEKDCYSINFDIKRLKIPLLGICYGHQLIASLLGGRVKKGTNNEYGLTSIRCNSDSPLFKSFAENQNVWMSHGDHVERLPQGCCTIAGSENIEIAAYESEDHKIFCTQFHPEVTHTENGLKILDNFLTICTTKRQWISKNISEHLIENLKKEAGDKKLALLVSGGVDSMVTLALCIKAVDNKNIFPIHIDTGFMRQNESQEVMNYLKDSGIKNTILVNAKEQFFKQLSNIVEPEEKRKIIGNLFVDIFKKKLCELNINDENWMLVQGTIYPDTIESGSTPKASKIKTHHNRVEEIQKLLNQGKVIEPLKELYKDEVRMVGKQLELPEYLISRHPFPGPGLAIRIIASDTDIEENNYRMEEEFFKTIINNYGFDGKILPIKSVGVQGDERSYKHPAVIFYNGNSKSDWQELQKCALTIVNKLKTINRIVFSFDKLTDNIKLQKCYLHENNVNKLQKVDAIVRKMVSGLKEIWQIPVVSLPVFDDENKQYFVIRPVCSSDAMTAQVYQMDFELLKQIIYEAKKIDGVSSIFYDITTKPPATIEWE